MNIAFRSKYSNPNARRSTEEDGCGNRNPVSDEEALLRRGSGTSTPKAGTSALASNPLLALKLVVRRIFLAIISDQQDGSEGSLNGVISLLADVIIGVVLGVISISVLIFLDHVNIVHLQSAHSFRETAFKLLNDPETIANLEESTEMKFVNMGDYNVMTHELNETNTRLTHSVESLKTRSQEVEEKEAELVPLRVEYEKLVSDPLLELDKFCGECSWLGRTTCNQRVQYLVDTYNTPPVKAKMDAMKTESCKKS